MLADALKVCMQVVGRIARLEMTPSIPKVRYKDTGALAADGRIITT
jgi:hypothetical protein